MQTHSTDHPLGFPDYTDADLTGENYQRDDDYPGPCAHCGHLTLWMGSSEATWLHPGACFRAFYATPLDELRYWPHPDETHPRR